MLEAVDVGEMPEFCRWNRLAFPARLPELAACTVGGVGAALLLLVCELAGDGVDAEAVLVGRGFRIVFFLVMVEG